MIEGLGFLSVFINSFAASGFGQFFINNKLFFITPELTIILGILTCIARTLSKQPEEQKAAWQLSVLTVFCSFITLLPLFQYVLIEPQKSYFVMNEMLQGDLFSLVSRAFLLIAFLIVLLMSRSYINERAKGIPAEFYVLLLTALLGGMLMTSAIDMIMLFVGLETLGISSYIMVGYLRGDAKSAEASLKYLVYGAASSAVLLFAFTALYGLAGGSTSLSALPAALGQNPAIVSATLPVILVMLMAGVGFKLSAAPFHVWTPDVYEGAPTPVTAFLSVVSKLAGFSMAIRLLSYFVLFPSVYVLLSIMALASMVLGNFVAILQSNIKRMLAYSTIAHAGYLLLGLVILSKASLAGLLFYLLTYVFMNLGAFSCVMMAKNWLGSNEISAYSGLFKKKPLFTLIFSIFLLALGGIPITAGFFAKFFLFQAVSLAGPEHLWLVVVALLTSTVSLYYYLNVIRVMVIAPQSKEVEALNEEPGIRFSVNSLGTAVTLSLIGTILLGFLASPIMRFCESSVLPLASEANTYFLLSKHQD